jgi:O-antigen ligase
MRILASRSPLSIYAEYFYYALLVNAIMADGWGISVPFIGAGAMVLLAAYCLHKLNGPFSPNYVSLRLPVTCAISVLVIRLVVHQDPLMVSDNRNLVMWIAQLFIIQSLLVRAGFLHRFGLAAFLIGLSLLPHVNLNYSGAVDGVQRAGLEHVFGYANPNDFAAWFGFCCVYFFVRSTQKTQSNSQRLVLLIAAAGSLFIVGLTVSRTVMGAIAIAAIIALRTSLKRGFLPVLLVAIVGFGFFVSGMFERAIGLYEERGLEDSGRFALWPLAFGRLIESPLAGVDDIATYVPEFAKEITPHNGFLHIGLSAGVFPLLLFTAYWIKAFMGAYQLSKTEIQDATFQLPLMIYTIITSSFVATGFMYPWAMVVLCNAGTANSVKFGLLRYGSAEEAKRARSYGTGQVGLLRRKELQVRHLTKY